MTRQTTNHDLSVFLLLFHIIPRTVLSKMHSTQSRFVDPVIGYDVREGRNLSQSWPTRSSLAFPFPTLGIFLLLVSSSSFSL